MLENNLKLKMNANKNAKFFVPGPLTAMRTHEYWQFIDTRFGNTKSISYGVFYPDGKLIAQLALLDYPGGDHRANYCPHLELVTGPVRHKSIEEKVFSVDDFGGRELGKPIYIYHSC